MNGLLRFALGIANMPNKTVTELDGSLPGFGRLSDLSKQIEPMLKEAAPLIEQAEPHLKALLPIIAQLLPIAERAWPLLKAGYPDLVQVTPTIEDLIAFARRQ